MLVRNPILGSDYPDPDVIRVKDTYYMVSTTMHFMPGAVILRSYDLGNWEVVTHIYDALEDTESYHLNEGSEAYGQGMWAPCLRYHDGMFYVMFTVNDIQKTFLYTAEEITGPWKRQEVEGFYYDPSLLFDDDGRCYVVSGNRQIQLTELREDLSGPKPGGLCRILFSDSADVRLGYEGSHIYKIHGRYYVWNIHWTTIRSQSCHVSDSLEGEFVGCDVLADDMGYHNQGVAQGGIVDTPEGKWYAVLFQDRGAIGRVPVLVPMHWVNHFPVLGTDGKVPEHVEVASTRPEYCYQSLYPSFDKTSITNPNWEWNHIPDLTKITLVDNGIQWTTERVVKDITHSINTLTRRLAYPGDEITITLDGRGMNPGDYAGIAAFESCYRFLALTRNEDGYALEIGAREPETEDVLPMKPAEIAAEIYESLLVETPVVTLQMKVNFEDLADEVQFFYKDCEGSFCPIGKKMKLYFKLDHFTGCRAGVFCFSTIQSGGMAVFDKG